MALTPARLAGARLKGVGFDVRWQFSTNAFVINTGKTSLPAKFVSKVFKSPTTAKEINGSWTLGQRGEGDGVLKITNVRIGTSAQEITADIPIRPAGHVRVEIGDMQYNVMKESSGAHR